MRPEAIKEAVSKEDAESFKAKLIEAGANAVIKQRGLRGRSDESQGS
ncbi:MAG: ribosomal protein L7/L12 [Oscillospiraceae bacterium]|nr:ribosomal protein L7/L12 [Oscillospiraceae bacterium]